MKDTLSKIEENYFRNVIYSNFHPKSCNKVDTNWKEKKIKLKETWKRSVDKRMNENN